MGLGSQGDQVALVIVIFCLSILFFELEIHEDYHIGALVPREKGVFCRQLICTSNVRVLEIRQFDSA